ncbi:acyl-CoA dehydrogenase family protein [Mycolicibacterium diernhoferi]|uniref:Pimeloyl-CoA dehydrogenase small subunit n=1 Tax=Mycolicibacterium diernhoferi TaxID=1801 RepID=A0A1Q4HG08_9MYCO|nr:acyl-CoA dehydrogenase family protein [Mycolicibacterium diernhoferi]OJZ66321.1 pimeloyl-CoA dehydrogenase small subunit [Mycolicibacterium diernhoferi]OPE50479.1 pimeloyl-CoA dehydrogenase small subunit [Mycolicibacterium diernhoferi]PEG54118.1 pimeloyl-CoA dehydrogenase small subunit [Mycolicibacterium diernhoferi]QYL24486.1 acyl-CoA dehydrogenase family protein [Mycolicibacterium diernhoferi]
MDFKLTGEQELLRDGLTKFLASRYGLESSRRAIKLGEGWQPGIWQSFADELGILGAALPEEMGGIGGGPVEIMVIAEALGHALVVEPYVDTVVVAGGLLQRAGGDIANGLLEKIAGGEAVLALAAAEAQSGDRWQDVTTTARAEGDGWVLDGAKIVVLHARLATHLLVTANTPAGLSLFLVDLAGGDPAQAPAGLIQHHYRTVDDRWAADIELAGVPATLLGSDGGAWDSLARARDEGAAAVCAEAVGNMRKVVADTVEYCKQRQQFGTPIGSFQALQHRMVDMHMELEQSVAAVYLAVLNLEAEPAQRARAVSAAKATVGRAARFVGQNAVQLHGGMGMTEELAIGHYFKRLTAVQYEFGSTDHHVARYAELTRP